MPVSQVQMLHAHEVEAILVEGERFQDFVFASLGIDRDEVDLVRSVMCLQQIKEGNSFDVVLA